MLVTVDMLTLFLVLEKKAFSFAPLSMMSAGGLSFSVPVHLLSHVQLFATPWTVAYQAPPSMGFSRQEYWSGLPFPSPGDLPNPGIEPGSPAFQADALTSEPPGKPAAITWSQMSRPPS